MSNMDDNFTTPWSSAKILVRKLKVGDLIEIRNVEENEAQLVTHWGVYVGIINGNHKIGHLACPGNNIPNSLTNLSSSDSTRQSTVRIDNLFDVCDKKECRKNNYIDIYLEPLPEKIIMYRVRSRLGSYKKSLFRINSAQFAKWTRNSQMNYGIITPWTSAGNLVQKLKVGDLIESRECIKIGILIYNH
uniref:LRAT domain-containing protein n=1 Tax=Strongyloides venezuelensis TaxID=75913 RepID=A0A0K0EUZ4_STRVS